MARPAWKALEKCCQELQKVHLCDFFAGEGSDFVNQGAIWRVNRFDPWGVELGKVLAQLTIPGVESVAEPPAGYDVSTNRLMRRYRRLKEAS
jgi:glucose-6-phosphate isomerase